MKDCKDEIINTVIACAIDVHKILGPGLLESVYEKALVYELLQHGIKIEVQVDVPVKYKDQDLGVGFKADIIVDACLLLELKSVDKLNAVHTAQVITYLRLLGFKRGYLLNFNEKLLKNGIKRISI